MISHTNHPAKNHRLRFSSLYLHHVELAMRKLGLVMMIASFLPWMAIFLIVPFLSLSLSQKALLVTALIISGEILFWLGVLLVGNVVFQQYQRYFNPHFLRIQLQKIWRRRK